MSQGDRAQKLVLVIGRAVGVLVGARIEADRLVHDDGRRGVALVDRGGEENSLEQRPELSLGLGGAVELTAVEAVSADHRENASSAVVERDQRRLDLRFLLECAVYHPLGFVDRDDPDLDEVSWRDQL